MKRTISIFLALTMWLSMVACGSPNAETKTSSITEGIWEIAATEAAAEAEPVSEWQYILDAADERRELILNTQPEIAITGTTYYVSNSGDDANDGLSPETAWATLERVFKKSYEVWSSKNDTTFLKPGDAVLLERGGTWYIKPDDHVGLTSDALNIPSGVVLGAYGTGERPVIRGDIPQASEPDFWELYYEENGVKIWASTEKLQDVNVIVLNGGESYAEEVMPYWSLPLNDYCDPAGNAFSIEDALSTDCTFCSLLDLPNYTEGMDVSNETYTGTLYLRCDAGNPAEVYQEIAVPQAQTGLELTTDAGTVGIDLRYFTCIAIAMSGYDGFTDQSVSNCEISWCGGLFHNFQSDDALPQGVLKPYCGGGALQVSGPGNSVKDCFIHDCGPFTLICTIHFGRIHHYENQTYTGNLIERCGTAMHIADLVKMDTPSTEYGFISNLRFSDNIVMDNGYGWVDNMISQIGNSIFYAAIENAMGAANNDGIYIMNNIFYRSPYCLLLLNSHLWESSEKVNRPIEFAGNTYIQQEGLGLVILDWEKGFQAFDDSDKAGFLELIGDTTGKVIFITEESKS